MGPYASRVTWTSCNSISRPGFRHAPKVSRRNVWPVPHRRGAQSRAAHVGPAKLVQGALQIRPIELAVAQKDHLGPLGDHLAQQCDDLDVEGLGTMPFGTVAHAPRQGQGAPLLDHVDHQRHAPTADDTAIHDHHQRL